MIQILSTGALATVQDLGREGALRWGVGSSGAMDPLALAAGNILLGNDDGAAGIEVPVFPLRLRFDADGAFAVTGADVDARLDDRPLLPWSAVRARAGQVLQLGLPRRGGHWPASRAYVCLAGGIDVPPVLGSRSTQMRGAFGGLDGRALRAADTLRAGRASGEPPVEGLGLLPPALSLPLQVDGLPAMRVLPAAEYHHYTAASRAAFWAEPWKITAQSDRYGYRLEGRPLEAVAAIEMRSHGIVPGVIQVPPGGQPIVQMRDAQPSGGYPKLGTVIEADLWRLGQAPVGSRVRFIECDWDGALAALAETRRWLDEARRLVGLQRLQHTRQ
ncbi:biotin-dependent carboxyltransferase family protein [Aquincola sp. S2]|uniref:Biotin-dependent carboxyltransferase family protein n=1 Tax=Pseudaquabacterium terrae TaxID=2732868 RepID=A0ABX2EGF9_9BURK|nr:biotin-dependent carboxyltransferase family protein [Aquabacterium terrae]NRF67703.1 biotin-dependent carboxyltransferase family protein [Aquabacterium terrae]